MYSSHLQTNNSSHPTLLGRGSRSVGLAPKLYGLYSKRSHTHRYVMDENFNLIQGLSALSPDEAIQVINDLPFAYYRADSLGKVTAASAIMAKIFGYEDINDVIGADISDHYANAEGRTTFLSTMHKNGGSVDNYEVEMVGRRGKFWVTTSARFLTNAEGEIIGVEGLTRDTTAQRLAFEEISQDAALFESFASSVDLGLGIAKPDGEEVFANRRIEELVGVAPASAEVANLLQRMPPQILELAHEVISAALEGKAPEARELLVSVEGKKLWRRFSFFLLRPNPTDPPYICTTVEDIHARKIQEAQLIQSSKLASVGELATGVAHEINQPLNALRLQLANLANHLERSGSLSEKVSTTLKRMDAQVDRAGFIVQQLLLFGRDATDEDDRCEPMTAIDNVRQLVEQTLRVADITFEVKGLTDNKEPKAMVTCNLIKLEQVIMNLIGNARDSILQRSDVDKTASYKGKIEIHYSEEESHCILTVKDNGTGIPVDIADRIFDPFVTSKPVGKGTGLGLSVSNGIIEAAGGTLRLENADEGACATIIVPLQA